MPHDVPKAENSHEPERDTRDQILDAAQNLFLARGYKAVAMKDIAEAVHITSAALYYHFSQGKEEVLLEMLQKMIGQWSEQLRCSIAQGGTLPDQLRRVVGIVSALPFDRLPMLVRDIQTQLSESIKIEIPQQLFKSVEQQITMLFQHAIDANEIDDAIPAVVLAQLFLGMLIAMTQSIPPGVAKRPLLANADEIIVSVLLHGISKRA